MNKQKKKKKKEGQQRLMFLSEMGQLHKILARMQRRIDQLNSELGFLELLEEEISPELRPQGAETREVNDGHLQVMASFQKSLCASFFEDHQVAYFQ